MIMAYDEWEYRPEWMMTHLVTGAHATFLTRRRAVLRSLWVYIVGTAAMAVQFKF